MLEPSKPKPSSNISADNSVAGIEKCCHNPGTSINFKSTISALFLFASSKASLTLISLCSSPSVLFHNDLCALQVSHFRGRSSCADRRKSHSRGMQLKIRITEYAHLGTVKPLDLDLFADANGRDEIAHLEPNVCHHEAEDRYYAT